MKQEKLYCGIDISNETIDVCIQQPDGSFVAETLSNSGLGFRKLMRLTKGYAYHYVMEYTGVYHMALSI
jgi:transposase